MFLKRFCKEVVGWRSLHHRNVLPLLGVTMTKNRFVMISEWVGNGNIKEFLKTHTDADPVELVCFLFNVLTLICY